MPGWQAVGVKFKQVINPGQVISIGTITPAFLGYLRYQPQ